MYTGSNPVSTSLRRLFAVVREDPAWAAGAAVARFPDTEEVTGSIPVSPTSRVSLETQDNWAYSAAVARFVHTEEVTGSIPVTPTTRVE